jgi:predicted nuclease of predicted toxin-antitoxin system
VSILADENIEAEIVARLRSDGLAVEYIIETGRGADDEDILERARVANQVLLTSDKDFGELVYRRHLAHAGVVLLRLDDALTAIEKADIVAAAFRQHGASFPSAFSVVTEKVIRMRPQSPSP